MQYRIPVSNWSKAPWGLSVLAQVTSIFTGTSISPGALSRQCPNHYAFRAGRNLPDKEFRYLRTVIVTAAVYWGLSSKLRLRYSLPLTFQHRAGVSTYTSALAFADTCVFAKQSLVTILCGLLSQAPLLPKLRGHFAEFLNKGSPVRLRILSSPTCVGFRYGRHQDILSSFSRQRELIGFVTIFHYPSSTSLTTCVLHYKPASLLGRAFPSARFFYLSVSLLHYLPR